MKTLPCLSLCLLLSLPGWAVPVLNGDFETGNPGDPPPFWMNNTGYLVQNAQLVAGLGVGGSQAVELLFTPATGVSSIVMDYQPDYIVGMEYTLSFFAASNDPQAVFFVAGWVPSAGPGTAQQFAVTGTLAQYSISFIASDVSGGASFGMLASTLTSASVYVDNVTITAAPELGGSPVLPLLFCSIGLLAARRAPGRK